jgi:hypothetical protein
VHRPYAVEHDITWPTRFRAEAATVRIVPKSDGADAGD